MPRFSFVRTAEHLRCDSAQGKNMATKESVLGSERQDCQTGAQGATNFTLGSAAEGPLALVQAYSSWQTWTASQDSQEWQENLGN